MNLLISFFVLFIIGVILFFIVYYLYNYVIYFLSKYKESGGHTFYDVFIRNNIGAIGEYYTYLKLQPFRLSGARFLNNVYLVDDKNNTLEIDLIMLHKTGIYVFESKNFSGWIFGKESDFKWCQKTKSYKNFFYNPIKQNDKHIEFLKNKFNHKYDRYFYSYIVFSERCRLKKVQYSGHAKVLRRNYLKQNVGNNISNNLNILSKEDIDYIYDILKQGINVNNEIKQKHIDDIYTNTYNKDNNKYELKKMNLEMGSDEYDMYQNIPKNELGSFNQMNGISYDEFKNFIKYYIKYENEINPKINTSTTRYIMYVNDKPIGEILIRTTLNDYWINRGSQVFYKIRADQRNKGYGNKILELGLQECKKYGMKQVRLNNDDLNIPSMKVINKNGGVIDIRSYKTKTGYSSSYIIKIN